MATDREIARAADTALQLIDDKIAGQRNRGALSQVYLTELEQSRLVLCKIKRDLAVMRALKKALGGK